MLKRIAVNDDDGWVHATLVGVAKLGPENARTLRLLELNRLQ